MRLDRHPWDVIPLRLPECPRFSGFAALEAAQASAGMCRSSIVSGTIARTIAVAMMKAGAHDYIMKGKLARLRSRG